MNILLVGGGAREHAMAAAITRNPEAKLFVAMAKTNPALAELSTGFQNLVETNPLAVVEYAMKVKAALAVIGPEAPEEAGVSDALWAAGIPCASPTKAAARIETDKDFMRTVMSKHNVPGRLGHHPFSELQPALDFLTKNGPVWAVKPVGLTGGKGVQVYGDHFQDVEGAKEYVKSIFASGAGGGKVQFEELARGEEFTLMALTDGVRILPMIACQDHKRLLEGDAGPNTGGMGSYSCADGFLPFLRQSEYDESIMILQRLVGALAAEGCPYRGAIYGQFMLTATGPKVIEINARFGDPEAMNVLHLLESDYVRLLEAMCSGELDRFDLHFRPNATVVKYLVPRGYGTGSPQQNVPIHIDEEALEESGATLYFGNVVQPDPKGPLLTLTSRTIAVLGEADTLEAAEKICEAAIVAIKSDGLVWRKDIGTAPLIQRRVDHMASIRGAA